MARLLDEMVRLLDLEEIEVNIFRGLSPPEDRERAFGGQVAAQSVVAATRTVPEDRVLHSLHSYFLRPGDVNVPIVYFVDRIRDGRSFTTRRVVAIQHGEAIFNMSASFQVAEAGLEHHMEMPEVPDPETLPTWNELIALVGIGALNSIGHICRAQAFKEADVSAVVPVEFTRLIWVSIFGFFLFGEIPEIWTWIGCIIIFAANVYIAVRERNLGKSDKTPPQPAGDQ